MKRILTALCILGLATTTLADTEFFEAKHTSGKTVYFRFFDPAQGAGANTFTFDFDDDTWEATLAACADPKLAATEKTDMGDGDESIYVASANLVNFNNTATPLAVVVQAVDDLATDEVISEMTVWVVAGAFGEPANTRLIEGADATTYIESRTLAAADYFLFGTDAVANVTLVATTTDLTNWSKTGYTLTNLSDANAAKLEDMLDGTGATLTANITGNITGNLSGSVGSVTGAVGSVTGNVGGNVVGSVASVTGAVGSVTGNLGGNVTGSVGSVTGNVGGNVTGSVGSVVGHTVQTGDTFALANGASGFVAIIADTAAILVDTGTTIPATLTAMSGAGFLTGTDSLEAIRNRGDAAWTTGAGGDATAANQVTIIADIAAVKADTAAILTDTGTTLPATFTSLMGAGFLTGTDSLEAIRDRGDVAWITGAGAATWTDAEKNQIRTALGLTGVTAATSGAGNLDVIFKIAQGGGP